MGREGDWSLAVPWDEGQEVAVALEGSSPGRGEAWSSTGQGERAWHVPRRVCPLGLPQVGSVEARIWQGDQRLFLESEWRNGWGRFGRTKREGLSLCAPLLRSGPRKASESVHVAQVASEGPSLLLSTSPAEFLFTALTAPDGHGVGTWCEDSGLPGFPRVRSSAEWERSQLSNKPKWKGYLSLLSLPPPPHSIVPTRWHWSESWEIREDVGPLTVEGGSPGQNQVGSSMNPEVRGRGSGSERRKVSSGSPRPCERPRWLDGRGASSAQGSGEETQA